MNLIIKGFIIGIGKVIPGVSGALLAIMMGIYEPILEKISNLKKNFIKNINYLSLIALGILLAIIFTSKLISLCLNRYYFTTMLLFIGMIIGGTKEITKEIKLKKKDTIIITLSIIIFLILTLNNKATLPRHIEYTTNFFLIMIIVGFIDAASSIIPGISGTAILMSLGYYNIVLEMFKTLLDITKIKQNLFIGIPFSIGIIIGIIVISKLLNYLLKKYKSKTYTIILFLIITTTITLFKNVISVPYTIIDLIIGSILFIIGILITHKLGKK